MQVSIVDIKHCDVLDPIAIFHESAREAFRTPCCVCDKERLGCSACVLETFTLPSATHFLNTNYSIKGVRDGRRLFLVTQRPRRQR